MANPLADELNAAIQAANPHVLDMLSARGKRMYFPKGILAQGAEAKAKAHAANATVGIATEGGVPMHLGCIDAHFAGLSAADVYGYAPPGGQADLREAWLQKMVAENPKLEGKALSRPMVTSALTHGLCITGELFVDPGDVVLTPDKLWGNYKLVFVERMEAEHRTFPFFAAGGFNLAGFEASLQQAAADKGKVVAIMNFPNNPSGYTPTDEEMPAIADAIVRVAESGCDIVVVCDDAYFGLFYEDACQESLFGLLAERHPRVLPIRLDGATKEMFAWGFRVGFITYGPAAAAGDTAAMLDALEKKTQGVIRATISNCSQPGQSIVLRALQSPEFAAQRREKFEILRARAAQVKKVLADSKYDSAWECYPFNSGYFMCLKLKSANAEQVRVRLLNEHGVGAISVNDTDLRVAFSCLEAEQIPPVFEAIYAACQ